MNRNGRRSLAQIKQEFTIGVKFWMEYRTPKKYGQRDVTREIGELLRLAKTAQGDFATERPRFLAAGLIGQKNLQDLDQSGLAVIFAEDLKKLRLTAN